MKKNVGTIDKVIRLLLGIALIAWGIIDSNWLGAIGAIPLLTALMNFCPLYTIIGIKTCKVG